MCRSKYIAWTLAMMWVSPLALAKTKTQSPAPAPATAPAAASSTPAPADKLDVTDLENKYWAPKDTDFTVVQNRTYTKEHKVFLSLQYGPDLNDHYNDGYDLGVTGNYFFNERYGIQATYLSANLHNNSFTNNFATLGGGAAPDFGRMQDYYGVGFSWVPFYAKMSVLGKRIIYFDMAITPTIGMTDYDQEFKGGSRGQSAFTYGIDLTQYYFFSKNFAIRADLKNQWYNESVVHYYTTGGTTGVPFRDQLNHTMIFLLGVSFYFGG